MILAVVLIGVIVAAVIFGRGGAEKLDVATGNNEKIRVIAGSEKMTFFNDPAVKARLKEQGMTLEVTPSGSRKISTRQDLKEFDAAFPSSAPAAEKIARETSPQGMYTSFHSPMAIATFDTIVAALEKTCRSSTRRRVVPRHGEVSSTRIQWKTLARHLKGLPIAFRDTNLLDRRA